LSSTVAAGIAINSAQTSVYAIFDDSTVKEYSVADNTLSRTFTLGFNGGVGGGLCLDQNEAVLYATGPGWELVPGTSDPVQMSSDADVNGFASIDLSTGTVTNIKTNEASDYAFNGCVVDGNTVYMVQFQRGVGSYNIDTGAFAQTLPWSAELQTLQDGSGGDVKLAGDGLTLRNGTFYVSMWSFTFPSLQATSNSAIWACNPSCASDCCTKLNSDWASGLAAADIGVFDGQLLIPAPLDGDTGYVPFCEDDCEDGTTTVMTTTTTDDSEDDNADESEDDLPSVASDTCVSVPSWALASAVLAFLHTVHSHV
jgi:hypothetical protein